MTTNEHIWHFRRGKFTSTYLRIYGDSPSEKDYSSLLLLLCLGFRFSLKKLRRSGMWEEPMTIRAKQGCSKMWNWFREFLVWPRLRALPLEPWIHIYAPPWRRWKSPRARGATARRDRSGAASFSISHWRSKVRTQQAGGTKVRTNLDSHALHLLQCIWCTYSSNHAACVIM